MGLFPLLTVTVMALGGLAAAPTAPALAYQPCAAGVPAGVDFNGDRVQDAAVGVPGKTVNGIGEAGLVEIRDVNGRISTLTAASPALNDNFGRALVTANLNGDACTDLVVGAPFHDVTGDDDSGAVYVFLGQPTGFHEAGLLRPGAGGVPGAPDPFAYFGLALGTGGSALYVGAPDASVGNAASAGTATILRLSFTAAGQVQATGTLLTENSPDVGGRAEPGEAFGSSFAFYRGQMMIGAPGEGAGGAVFVVAHDGLVQVLTQDTAGMLGAAESGDEFGRTLYVHDDTLVVGSPSESIGAVPGAGMIHVIPFDAAILRTNEAVGYSQNSAGVAGGAEVDDGFGWALGTSLDGGLLAGSPRETVGTVAAAGMVVEVGTGRGWTMNTAGVPGDAVVDGYFGHSLGGIGGIPLAGAPGVNGWRGQVLVGLGWPAAKVWTLNGPANTYQGYGYALSTPGSPGSPGSA